MATEAKLAKTESGQSRYFASRREELVREHPELTTKRKQDQRMRSEWQLLSSDEKRSYERRPGEDAEVGVEEFLTAIKQARKEEVVDPEFEEDEVLTIVNHKKNWKFTYGRKKKARAGALTNSELKLN